MDENRVERRKHRVFLTRNTEYHVRDGVCVGVRDRKHASWMRGHMAVDQRVAGAVTLAPEGMMVRDGEPKVGEGISFGSADRRLVTAAVEKVDRPSKEIVALYPVKR